MTLQAVEPSRVTIDKERRYSWCPAPDLPSWCSVPGCSSTFKLQKHHIVRRSATGGPLNFITIDNLVIQNVCMLCREHHGMVTGSVGGHRLWIIYESGEGWQVYKHGSFPPGGTTSKGGTTWIWVGALRMGNRE